MALGLASEARAQTSPAIGSPPAAADVSTAVQEHLRGMFQEGYTIGSPRLRAAQQHLQAARRLLPLDPRLAYAHALILRKQLQHQAAITQFEAAAKSDQGAYWPAWQALTLIDLTDKQSDRGLRRLEEFATLVQESGAAGVAPPASLEAAQWIGRVLEGLDKTCEGAKLRARLERCDQSVRDRLSGDLGAALEQGRQAAREQSAKWKEQIEADLDQSAEKQEQEKQEQATKLETKQEAIEQQQAATAVTAEELKKRVEEQLAQADKQLRQFEKDYSFLEKRAESLSQSMSILTREIMELERVGSRGFRFRPNLQAQLQQARQQSGLYEAEFNANLLQIARVSQAARGVQQQRVSIVSRYEAATGQLLKKNFDLQKWAKRVDTQKQKLATQPLKKSVPLEQHAKSLRAYVALDLEVERDRVLASFGLVPLAPSAQK
jgi:hypothetical protein